MNITVFDYNLARPKITSISPGHHSRSMQAIASETLGCDTSIDITKFLSRSTNTLPPSARSSRRNFSLKVRPGHLDEEDVPEAIDISIGMLLHALICGY